MDNAVPEIVDRMLRFSRTGADSTKRLELLKHDKDLLPQFQRQLERVLESYGKLSPLTYDTQGLRDQGVDIAIRIHNENEEFHSLIGFQIKNADDLIQDDYLQKLKAQHDESSRIKGLQQYYIVICVNEKGHKKRLRTIESEFKSALHTRVIEPTQADFFLSLTQERIDAYIRRTLAGGDVVLKRALEAVDYPSRMTGALLVYLTVRFFIESTEPVNLAAIKGSGVLRSLHEVLLWQEEAEYEASEEEDVIEFDEVAEVQSDFEAQIHRDLDTLSDGPIVVDGESISVRFEQVTPLIALATDAIVRYEYASQSVTAYLLNLLGLSE
jgi:hypothetical protein